MKKTLVVLALFTAAFAVATPASARDCGCNPHRGGNGLISVDANVGGHRGRGGLVDVDANVGGRNGLVDANIDVLRTSRHGGGLLNVDANVLGRNNGYGHRGGNSLVDVDANVGGRRNGLLNLDVGILGGGVGGGH